MDGGDRVVAFGHQHDVPVLHRHRLVQRAVVGVNALEGKTLRRVEPMVVGLLEQALARQIVGVVLVGRIGGGVAVGRDHFHHQQRIGGIAFGQDISHVPRIAALAAHDRRVGTRRDQPRRQQIRHARSRAHRQFEIGRRLNRPVNAGGRVDGIGFAVERAHALPDLAEITVAGLNPGLAGHQHEAHLAMAGVLADPFPGAKPVEIEPDIAPARRFRRYVLHPSGVAQRPKLEAGHRFLPACRFRSPARPWGKR